MFFITFINVFFILEIKNAFFNIFYFFPNVYYNYVSNVVVDFVIVVVVIEVVVVTAIIFIF